MGNASVEVCEFCYIRNLQHGPLFTKGIWVTIKKFKATKKLGVQPGRGCKPVTPVFVGAIRTAIAAQSQTSEFGGSNSHAVS